LNDQQMNLGTYEETIEKLMRERETLVKGLEAERSSLLEQLEAAKTSNSNEKLEKALGKLKKMLKTTKDKINELVVQRADLFADVGDDMNERLDHLISLFQNQDGMMKFYENQLEQMKTMENNKMEAESQTDAEQRVSRRTSEHEVLSSLKETDQIKQYVKQIDVEKDRLKSIIARLERLAADYVAENDRLKQENQHLVFLSYSKRNEIDDETDTDICYLTLKCLTYEVAQRLSSERQIPMSTSMIFDENDRQMKQHSTENDRQMKLARAQNQRLRAQLEKCHQQMKTFQNDSNVKSQEIVALRKDLEKIKQSETNFRFEVERLKVELQNDQIRFQQFQREIADLKFDRNENDESNCRDNLRELLELKERELRALKEKLDYTTEAHQFELQEAIKTNQFSLENVQRFEQLDQQNQEKRRNLESRLGQFCQLIRPILDQQTNSIDLRQLEELVNDTEAEARVTTSLGSIRDCLGLLENQMKDLHHNLIENHAQRSQRWKYKLGFECSSCDSQWEVTHDIRNLQDACHDPNLFLQTSIVEPMTTCSCPTTIDFIRTDVQLCLADLIDEVIVRTTVK